MNAQGLRRYVDDLLRGRRPKPYRPDDFEAVQIRAAIDLGNVTFYSGTTTAYPLPPPGDGPAPKPITLPAGKLHNALGIRQVSYTKGQKALALKEQTLS